MEEIVRTAPSQAPPKPAESETLEVVPSIVHFKQAPQMIQMQAECKMEKRPLIFMC